MLQTKSVAELNEVEVVLGVFGVAGVIPAGKDKPRGGGMSEGAGEQGE